MTEMEKAFKSLYDAFARYSRPQRITVCPCCTKPEATSHLTVGPLRELCFEDLADYSFSAMTTQGSVDDFRYVLPRLLQGIAEEPYSYNPEILFGKLRYANWTIWPVDEVSAVRTYLHALWVRGLTSFPLGQQLPAFFEIETLLASIAQTGEALEPYLQVWSATRTEEADAHLIQFVTMFGAEFSDGRTLHEAFWTKAQSQAESLRKWLLRLDTLRRIEHSAYLLRNDGFEHLFEPALKNLQHQSGTTES
jgi:hypothetical protein